MLPLCALDLPLGYCCPTLAMLPYVAPYWLTSASDLVGGREVELLSRHVWLQKLQSDVDVSVPAAGALAHDCDRCLVVGVHRDLLVRRTLP